MLLSEFRDWFVSVSLGVEDVAAGEIAEITGSPVAVDVGKVFFKAPLREMYRVNYLARTINRLYLLLYRGEFKDLDDIYRASKSIDYSEVISPNMSFAVRCERIGSHSFTSIDVARVVGQAVIDSYMERKGVRLKVNLDNPDVEISVFVRFNELLIGVNTTGTSLHRRKYRVFSHKAALKTTLAASMLRIGGYRGQALLDPLCGGATIPIEAAHMARRIPISMFRDEYNFKKLPIYDPEEDREVLEELMSRVSWDRYEITCIDISPKSIEGAKLNAESAKVVDTIRFILGDSTRYETYRDVKADLIVTNPPYGMRSHRLKVIEPFYVSVLKTLSDLYRGVKLVLITAATRQFESAAQRVGVKVESSRRVMHGGLHAKIYEVAL
jgi:tRNA (guanine6-N2)-methyltransferase